MRRTLRSPAAPAVVLIAVLAAGCGGGDEPADGATTAATGAATASAAATGAATEAEAAPSPTPGPTDGDTYTVQSGDTLSSIAQEFDTTVDALVEANDIADPDIIGVGEELTIP